MRLSRKVELQPTPTQVKAFMQHAGNARWTYNWGLKSKIDAIEVRKDAIASGTSPKEAPRVPTYVDLSRELTVLKKTPVDEGGIPWMYEASSQTPIQSLRDLDTAFKNFFRRLKNGAIRKGFPRFKSRNRGIGGFHLKGIVRVGRKAIQLPFIGRVRLKPGDRNYLPWGKHTSATVTERAGRWYVSVLEPDDIKEIGPSGKSEVGLDLGVARLATLSDGTVIDNPRALAPGQRKIKKLQRELARKKKGSRNRKRARALLARAYARVTNVRKDTLHKVTTALAKRHSKIVIEDLNVANMTRAARGQGRKAKAGLNRSLLDASFSEFRRQLEYKGKLYGCEVIAVNPAYTSQRCSVCGHTEKGNRLTQSAFRCLSCGFEINADRNASINILVDGSCPETLNASGEDVRLTQSRLGKQTSVKLESVVA